LPANEAIDPAAIAARLATHVREAGSLAFSMFGTPVKTWTKGESSPVSEADIAVDRLLHARLVSDNPDGEAASFGWLSEESTDDPARLAARRVWIVDPIDGTRAYIAGEPDWAVSVALVEDGRPVAACLYAPVMEALFVAAAGQGATRNGVPIAATAGASLVSSRIAGPKRFLERLAAVAPPLEIMPRMHSLALRLARVAEGAYDAAIAGADSHDWDLAAADLLVHEAGGTLSSLGGGTIVYNRPVPRHGMLLAAGRDRHAALVELLKDERLAS
jgi:myo-inositol-1(or 4)-monophosphatase